MDNFDKLHADQDAFIKGVFHEDKIVSQPVLDSFEQYLEKTKIKADKYTHKQKRIILLLIILLLISVGYNIYLTLFPRTANQKKKKKILSVHHLFYLIMKKTTLKLMMLLKLIETK